MLDIRIIAEEWRSDEYEAQLEAGDLLADFRPDPRFPRLHSALAARRAEESASVDVSRYVALCSELGCDADPDSLEGFGDNYEPTLIPEHEFENYARELAEDIGAVPADSGWPSYCIDWQRAAEDLSMDYITVTYDGNDYLIRSW